MSKPKSKKVANPFEGRQVYEALQELDCKQCGAVIKAGEHFVRPSLGGLPVRTGPVCQKCESIRNKPREEGAYRAL
jgi:hypothetical protein